MAVPASAEEPLASPSSSGPPPGPPVEFIGLPGSTTPPQIDTFAWVVADANTGEILAAKGPNTKLPQASTMKTLTALTLMPRLDPQSEYRASEVDAAADGGLVGIVPGATYKVRDLWNGLLLPSGNDAAMALANAYGGLPATISAMEAEARRVGAVNTHPKNPSGLDSPGQVSTPVDLATIYRAALQNPLFREVINTKTARFPGEMPAKAGGKRPAFTIASQDHLLHKNYPGIIGGKSGYTTKAGRTFVGGAQRGNTTLIYALMRTTMDTEKAAAKLLDWGFANVGKVTPVGQLPEATAEPETVEPRAALRYTVSGKLEANQVLPEVATPAAEPVQTPDQPDNQAADGSQTSATINLTTDSVANNLGVVRAGWVPIAVAILIVMFALVAVLRIRVLVKRRRRRQLREAQIAREIARDREYELTNNQ